MSELRCPMCGNPNLEDAQLCRVCQAQLKPILGAQGSDSNGGESNEVDWLSGLRDGIESQSESPAGEGRWENDAFEKEVPDWLARIRQRARMEEEANPKDSFSTRDDLSLTGDENPDWLKEIQSGSESARREERSDAWLDLPEGSTDEGSKTVAGGEDDSSLKAAEAPPAQGDDIPDWLNGGEEEQPSDEAAGLGEEADLPFWLKALEGESAQAPPGWQPPGEQEELPDWVHTAEAGDREAEETVTAREEGEVPAWVGAFSVAEEETREETATDEEVETAEMSAFLPGETEREERIGAPAAFTIPIEELASEPEADKAPPPFVEEPIEGEAFVSASPFTEGSLFEWLDELASEPILEKNTSGAAPFSSEAEQEPTPAGEKIGYPFSGDDLPDWLSDVALAETSEYPLRGHEQPSSTGEAELQPSELPGWLEAIRPLEAVAPEAETEGGEETVASDGPLAGLPGILAPLTQAVGYSKPPGYSARLRLTEKQRAHADLLEKMLADETQPRQARLELIKDPQRLLRLMVGVILIAVLIFSASLTVGTTGLYAPLELFNFNNQIEAIPDGAPVLLAFEYQPGYSAEMQRIATGMLNRLMAKNTRLTLVSTVPAGPILAEQLIVEAAARLAREGGTVNPGYAAGEMIVNLGYLPGGIASLQEFSLRPQQASRYGLTSALDGTQAWTHPALAGVGDLRDFSAVVVVADSLESGRAWLEQVQPALGETPLLVVASAQAAPLLVPYLASGQVSGMIAGVTSGMVYQEISQTPLETGFLNAYRSGMLLAVLLILVGIIIHSVSLLFAARKSSSG